MKNFKKLRKIAEKILIAFVSTFLAAIAVAYFTEPEVPWPGGDVWHIDNALLSIVAVLAGLYFLQKILAWMLEAFDSFDVF